ncbi:MAG: CRTAC1 family protein, partial [Acidobacteria bacterium]|nr:CRTAC1 family protein [Acidobacteriota bacterium]
LPARGLGVVCHDFTGDGRPDFYVANDTEANHLWVNGGDGAFAEEALLLGAALSGFGRPEAGMGIEIGDLSGDGVLDILLTHFADETNTVYLAEPGIGFVDGSIDLGLGTLGLATTGFGVALSDFDLDGFLDAVIANGRVARPPGESPRNPFFAQYEETALVLRGGHERFEDAGAASPELSARSVVGRGLAAGDLDGDGDPDLILTAAAGPARVFENVSNRGGNWLLVATRLPGGVPDHGATVRLRTSAGTRVARANPGVSYLSSGDPRAHFGIPGGDAVESLTVRWSDGSEEAFPAPTPNRVVVVVRGAGTSHD